VEAAESEFWVNQLQLERAADEADIRRVIYRYCRGVDRVDLELVRSCYHPGAQDSHGTFVGDVDEFVDWLTPLLANYEKTVHFVGNLLIEFDDAQPGTAFVETYAIAFHRSASPKPMRNMTITCRYVDRFERRSVDGGPEEWRIADRLVVTDLLETGHQDSWVPIGESILQGQRDDSDAVFRAR
jgi:SnoaL-like domain